MATVAAPKVDLDLFATSYAAGLKAGASVPTGFSAFAGGFFEGYDKEIAAESVRQQNEIRENEIEQIPVNNRIKEAQADRADAELTAYRNNPEQYEELANLKTQNDLAEQKRQAQFEMKRTEFIDIMNSGDGVATGKAYTSGQFSEVFAADEKLKKQVVEDTLDTWDKADQDIYFKIQQKGRERDWYGKLQERTATQILDAQDKYMANDTLASLAEKAEISLPEMLEGGQFKTRLIPPQVPKPVLDDKGLPAVGPDKKVLYEVDQNGEPVMMDAETYEPKDMKKVVSFYHKDKLISDVEDTDARKIFSNYKQLYKINNSLLPGQGGDTDKANRIKQKETQQRVVENTQAAAMQSRSDFTRQQTDAFLEGVKVQPPYEAALATVKNTRSANLAENAANTSTRIEPASAPKTSEPTIPDPVKAVINPAPREMFATPTRAMKMSDDEFLAKSLGNVDANRTVKFQGIDVPETTVAREARQRRTLEQAKARAIVEKRNPNVASTAASFPTVDPNEQRATPFQQVSTVTESKSLPAAIMTPGKADINVVRAVQSRPEVEGFSALTKAVMAVESAGAAGAESPTGVKGLMQVTRRTAAGISSDIDRDDPVQSTIAGAIEIERMVAQFEGNTMLGLTAYNAGPGVVSEAIALARQNGVFSTDWSVIKEYIPAAVQSPRFASEWARYKIDPKQKAKEAREYAEKVMPYFAAFARTNDDMRVATALKNQKVLSF